MYLILVLRRFEGGSNQLLTIVLSSDPSTTDDYVVVIKDNRLTGRDGTLGNIERGFDFLPDYLDRRVCRIVTMTDLRLHSHRLV